jgi:hypothetical protein
MVIIERVSVVVYNNYDAKVEQDAAAEDSLLLLRRIFLAQTGSRQQRLHAVRFQPRKLPASVNNPGEIPPQLAAIGDHPAAAPRPKAKR